MGETRAKLIGLVFYSREQKYFNNKIHNQEKRSGQTMRRPAILIRIIATDQKPIPFHIELIPGRECNQFFLIPAK